MATWSKRLVAIMAAAFIAGVAAPPDAHAKLKLTFDRPSARVGERVRLTFGEYFTSRRHVVRVYLVRASILGEVIRPPLGGAVSRFGPPPRRAGVVAVAQTRSSSAGVAFRVPRVREGRYAAVIWCSTCPHPYLLASFPGSVPDDAYVRAGRTLLRVLT